MWKPTIKLCSHELASVEPNLNVTASEIKSRSKVIDKTSASNLVNSLYSVPNGVIKMSADIEGLVETSTNLAVVVTKAKSYRGYFKPAKFC